MVFITDDLSELKLMMEELSAVCEQLGLNFKKTRYMNLVLSDRLKICAEEIEQVQKYIYQGHETRLCGRDRHLISGEE